MLQVGRENCPYVSIVPLSAHYGVSITRCYNSYVSRVPFRCPNVLIV